MKEPIPLQIEAQDITDDPRILAAAAMSVGIIAKVAEDAGLECTDMGKILQVMIRINDQVQSSIKLHDVKGHA